MTTEPTSSARECGPMEYDGTDTDGTVWNRCATHGHLVTDGATVCEGYAAPPYVSVRDDYAPRFGRQVLSLWSGSFASDHQGYAVELPGHDGFMVTGPTGGPRPAIRVECAAPRTDANYLTVDSAIARGFIRLVSEHAAGVR